MALRPRGFLPSEVSAIPNLQVIELHAGDAGFLWSQRDRAVGAPHYRVWDLARLDERVEAHLNGLLVAGEVGWNAAQKELAQENVRSMFVVSALAFERGENRHIKTALGVCLTNDALIRGVLSGIGWVGSDKAGGHLQSLRNAEQPNLRAVAIGGYAVLGVDPGESLNKALSDRFEIVRARAYRAAGELGRTDFAYPIAKAALQESEDLRYWAAWASARLGLRDRKVLDVLRTIGDSESAHALAAMEIALRCIKHDEAKAWLARLLKNPETVRRGVIGIGVLGDAGLLVDLLDYMHIEKLARVAGESFSMITGLDLKFLDLNTDKPEGFQAGPSENPEDEDVAMDADEDLPWPSHDLLTAWLEKHRRDFQPGTRYLCGQPMQEARLREVLRRGFQRQRRAAALELGLLRPSTVLLNVRRRGKLQMQEARQWNS